MTLSPVKGIKMFIRFIKFFEFDSHVILSMSSFASRMSNQGFQNSKFPYPRTFSTSIEPQNLSRETFGPDILLEKLNRALRESKDEATWQVFVEFKTVYGFPPAPIISKLITRLSYSSDHCLLQKAYELGFKIARDKSELIQHDTLSRLCLSLGRAQMFVPASRILRLMLHENKLPTMDVLSSIIMHIVKTEAGTNLATNILIELCDSFNCLRFKRSECAMSMKPSTTMFNLVLDACVRFGSSLKGQEIIEVMAQAEVAADACSVVLFACIYEMNGQRDEVKKFKEYVDRLSIPLARNYSQFYDKLMSLHFKFDDVDAAAGLVVDMYLLWGSRSLHKDDLANPRPVPIGSPYLKESLKVQVMFESLQRDSFCSVKDREEFIVVDKGKLVLTSKGLAQLIIRYRRTERISEMSKLLIAIEKEVDTHEEGNLCCDVIHACIYNGWLETAHDILDDMEVANVPVPTSTYMLLLNAYCRQKMSKEAEALAKQIKSRGLLLGTNDGSIVSECLLGVAQGSNWSPLAPVSDRQAKLTNCLVLEIKRVDEHPVKVFEINTCIYFFCKAKMMEDALKTYRKLPLLKIQPTVHTFAYLIQGFSSLGMYREITILWGDMKRYVKQGSALENRDLYETLLINFLRGGYFERGMEVLSHMKEQNMYADRWMYKNEFTRLHKNLYRKLKATDAKNEAQRLRLEHVNAFRKWVRNN